jgi:hypothetical protein
MLRTAVEKIAWVGRAASMVFGLALVLVLVFAVASMALGARANRSKRRPGDLDPLARHPVSLDLPRPREWLSPRSQKARRRGRENRQGDSR